MGQEFIHPGTNQNSRIENLDEPTCTVPVAEKNYANN